MKWMRSASFLLSLALLLAAGTLSYFAYGVRDAIRYAHEIQERSMTLNTTWKDAENLTHTVSTPRASGESADEHAARHKEGVDALKALYPPVE